jgi:hypothetical protein
MLRTAPSTGATAFLVLGGLLALAARGRAARRNAA